MRWTLLAAFLVAPSPVGSPRSAGRTGDTIALATPRPDRVPIPAGAFRMGSTARDLEAVEQLCLRVGGIASTCTRTRFLDETPRRLVRLPAYRIDRTEVTVGAYQRCAQAGICRGARHFPGDHRFDDDTQPAVGVSWLDADTYCRWAGGRLPTEAEWERAARGVDARPFPWGWNWNPMLANHGRIGVTRHDDRDGFRYTAPVGSFPDASSPYGLQDMAGNVSEWVADFYDERLVADRSVGYRPGELYAPRGPRTGVYRVLRGGSWGSPAHELRTAMRSYTLPEQRGLLVGFRCAEDA